MREVFLVAAVRTPFCAMGGNLRAKAGTQLAGIAIKELLKRTEIAERGTVNGIFVGSARHCSVAQNPGRYLVMEVDLPIETEGHYVESQSGSAVSAINHAASQIALGFADVCIAGGFESWSTTYAKYSRNVEPYTLQPPLPIRQKWTNDAAEDLSPLDSSENLAKRYGISRIECDIYAKKSREKFAEAVKNGVVGDDIVPYVIPATRKTPEIVVNKDEPAECPMTMEGMENLQPVQPGGIHTAANMANHADGAAVVLLMSGEKVRELGYEPLAKWVIGADEGVPNSIMGIGSARAAAKAIRLAELDAKDIDVFEMSEAFAAEALAAKKELELITDTAIDMAKWNPCGGAIATGDANGASGAKMAYTAIKQMERIGGKYAVVSCSCEGGQGVAMVLESVGR